MIEMYGQFKQMSNINTDYKTSAAFYFDLAKYVNNIRCDYFRLIPTATFGHLCLHSKQRIHSLALGLS